VDDVVTRTVVRLAVLSIATAACRGESTPLPPAGAPANAPPAAVAAPAADPSPAPAAPDVPPSPDEARLELGKRNLAVAPESLIGAAKDCDARVVTLLVSAGVPIDTPDIYGEPPLLKVAKYGLFDPKISGPEPPAKCRATFDVLLRAGARPNVSHLASLAGYGETELVRRILDDGVDPNEVPPRLMPCCPLKAAAGGGHLETVELLVARGTKVTGEPQAMGQAVGAVHHLDREGSILKFLLAHGGDVNARVDNYQATPLMVAATRGLPTAVRILIAAGADVHAKDAGQRTAWDRARESRGDNGAMNLDVLEMIERAGGKSQRAGS
jgi:ankyrin repeat protein